MVTVVRFPWSKKDSEVEVTTHIQLLTKLRMRGAIPTLMACTSVISQLIYSYKK